MARSNKPPRPSTCGVLILDKPLGMTSMSAVAAVRSRAGGPRTGHAGTLDPLATGVLVIAMGKATKQIEKFMATTKRYLTTVDLSAFTNTDDLEGERTEVQVTKLPTQKDIADVLPQFMGRIMQRPPARSAIKIDGQRAYKLDRAGVKVEIPPRPIEIFDLQVRSYEWPLLDLYVHCGKGTYIRSLARNIGEALGTGGHCKSIRRTAVGPFTIENAQQLDDVPQPLTEADLISLDDALELLDFVNQIGQASSRTDSP
ncbi:MAG: tRNA pseudouridine(55) synthase TruB [Planctomycetes bacterium]|nr:tRNA pseudouridine(55) synthase TruB [Planctomycetota bacterium]